MSSFVPDFDRPIPRRPLAKRKTTARTITFVRNWDSDVSDGGLSFNQLDKSKDSTDLRSISQRIASSPVPVVIASPRPVYSHLPVHNEVDEDGEGEESSNEENILVNGLLPENNQRHREPIEFDGDEDEETIPDSYASSSNAFSPPIASKYPSHLGRSIQSNNEQVDIDKESVSTKRSRHTSGRSNRSSNSASTTRTRRKVAIRRSLQHLLKLNDKSAQKESYTDDEQVNADKESVSAWSSRHRSGRSPSSIASTSTASNRGRSLKVSKVMENVAEIRQTDDEQVHDDRESGRSSRHKSGRSNRSITSASVKSTRSSHSTRSKVMVTSAQIRQTDDEQVDDDGESHSGRSSRRKSGRSNSSITSTKSIGGKSSRTSKVMDTSPQDRDSTKSGQSRTVKGKPISSGPGSTVSTPSVNWSTSSKSSRKRQLRSSTAESRKRLGHDKENINLQNIKPQAEVQASHESSQTEVLCIASETPHNSDHVSEGQLAKKRKLSVPRASSQTESDDDMLPAETGYIVRLWQGNQKRNGVSSILDLDIILNHFEETAWDARQQTESVQVKKAINHFAKGVQSELRAMIAKVAKAKKVSRSLGNSERTLNKKRKELLSVQQRLCAVKYNVAKLRHVLNSTPSQEEDST